MLVSHHDFSSGGGLKLLLLMCLQLYCRRQINRCCFQRPFHSLGPTCYQNSISKKGKQLASKITLLPAFPTLQNRRELPCAEELAGRGLRHCPCLIDKGTAFGSHAASEEWRSSVKLVGTGGREWLTTLLRPPAS